MKFAFLSLIVLCGVMLAGCTADEAEADGDPVVDRDPTRLTAGKGAIAGLLVDDRFRPIHLVESPDGEFQAAGFVLVQEAGQQVRSNENGEFAIVDLEPGTYTLRVSASGHEATPQRVTVKEGEFAEVSVVARRVASDSNLIITQEFAVFASCFTNFVILSVTLDCTGDLSGDTDRGAWYPNLSEFNDTLHYVVVEALFNNEAPPSTAYDLVARHGAIGTDYSGAVLRDGDGRYAKLHLPIGRLSPDPVPVGSGCDESPISPDDWCPFTPDRQLQIIIFGRGYMYQEIQDAYRPANEVVVTVLPCSTVPVPSCLHEATLRRGAGGAFGTQATYLMSLFLFDPEADGTLLHETDYCALCNPDA